MKLLAVYLLSLHCSLDQRRSMTIILHVYLHHFYKTCPVQVHYSGIVIHMVSTYFHSLGHTLMAVEFNLCIMSNKEVM